MSMTDFFLGGAADRVVPVIIRSFFKQGTDFVGGKVKDLVGRNPKLDFMQAFLLLEPEDKEALRYHLKKAIEEGRMKELALAFSLALQRKEDGTVDREATKSAVTQIAKTDPFVLEQVFEALGHSTISQYLEHELEHLGAILEKIMPEIGYGLELLDEFRQKIEQKTEERRKTIFGGLAHFLFK